jgi:hypothetical protein
MALIFSDAEQVYRAVHSSQLIELCKRKGRALVRARPGNEKPIRQSITNWNVVGVAARELVVESVAVMVPV